MIGANSDVEGRTCVGLIDFHCHFDLYADHAAAVAACEAAGVRALAVTTTPRAWPRNHELASATQNVRAALGMHPQLAGERADELPLWEHYLPQTRYVGEVGLDARPRFFRSLDTQKRIFTRVLQSCAEHGGKVLSVHSVRAVRTVLDAVETYLPPSRGTVVLHWFTGTAAEARRAVDLGCYFSINVEMLRSARHQAMIVGLPLERLLTETDGPFTMRDGRPTVPSDIRYTLVELARSRGLDMQSMQKLVQRNLRSLLEC